LPGKGVLLEELAERHTAVAFFAASDARSAPALEAWWAEQPEHV
jgi:hypothetical protein